MKIGFYGDSFCEKFYSSNNDFDTYIKKVADNYGLSRSDVVNLGYGGSSIWDTMLIQFDLTNIDNKVFPDVLIFVWTDYNRLFHRKVRRLNSSSVFNGSPKMLDKDIDIINAAKEYYLHLMDTTKEDFAYVAALRYFDDLLSKISNKCKIIHMWSFFNPGVPRGDILKENYYFRWKSGVEIRPALIYLSLMDTDISCLTDAKMANHIGSEYKNTLLANTIIDAINNYENGKLIDYRTNK
jgi:hypothetical protein